MVTDTDITLKNGGDIVLAKRGLIKADEVRQMTVNCKAEAEGFSRGLVGVHGDIVMHRV
jgi:hypothetical protein